MRLAEVQRLLDNAVRLRVTPGAALEAGRSAGVLARVMSGTLSYDPASPSVTDETVYDLASLTKVIATASVAMRLVEDRRLDLATHVADVVAEWRGVERTVVTVRDLLEHCSGLPGWAPLFLNHEGRGAFAHAIAEQPLEYTPWTRAVYSDLGFILLGLVLEQAAAATLDEQFGELGLRGLLFRPATSSTTPIAPTRADPWRGRLLAGEVDDDNAWALGGVAGHAGLFGTASAAGDFARLVLRTYHERTTLGAPETLRRFVARSTVPRSSRALAWDTMRPTSSCGTRMSPRAVGHTGFTGTSLWIDPDLDLYVVLLTNRVHPEARADEGIQALRRAVHDAVAGAVR